MDNGERNGGEAPENEQNANGNQVDACDYQGFEMGGDYGAAWNVNYAKEDEEEWKKVTRNRKKKMRWARRDDLNGAIHPRRAGRSEWTGNG